MDDGALFARRRQQRPIQREFEASKTTRAFVSLHEPCNSFVEIVDSDRAFAHRNAHDNKGRSLHGHSAQAPRILHSIHLMHDRFQVDDIVNRNATH